MDLSRLNPVRLIILWTGLGLARLGLIDRVRAVDTTDLAWPRILTGLARMSKSAADVAMVGIAVGPAAIAGVGFAGPYWGVAFTIGAGLATGTIALVSQRYGADAFDELGQAVRTSVLVVVLIVVPIAVLLYTYSAELIDLLSNDAAAVRQGSLYLQTVAFGVPFAALNLIGSRILIGADDAWTPMVLRGSGAIINIGVNAVLIFYLGMGVVGAALGMVLSNFAIAVAFGIGLTRGGLPLVGAFPVTIDVRGTYAHLETATDLLKISVPVLGRNMVWTGARFPMLAFMATFGSHVVAAYIVSRRIWGLMGTPGWGFGLAASSLVGQSLGEGDEDSAERYGHEITRFATATYALVAVFVLVFASPIVRVFINDPTGPAFPVAVNLVRVACVAVVIRGVGRTYAGALDATGDTRWPFYARVVGMFGLAVPLVYLGATTSLGLYGLYLSYFGQSIAPSIINYYRFSTGKWKAISEEFRPDAAPATD